MNYFAQPLFLYSIPIIIIGLLIVYLYSRKKAEQKLKQLISPKLKNQLIPSYSKARQFIKCGLLVGSIGFILIALSGPQWGTSKRTIKRKAMDLLIAVDVSISMNATDEKPNRLERLKLTLSNLLPEVKGNRLGLISFQDSSFLNSALTLDHRAFAKRIQELNVGMLNGWGTNLASPIKQAFTSFSKDDTDKFLLLISDGGNSDPSFEEETQLALKEAKEKGIRIFTIGIGAKSGAFVPGVKDEEGKSFISQLDEPLLQEIATDTGGQYSRIGSKGEGINHAFSELKGMGQKKLREQFSTSLPINRYQIFALIGLALLISEFLTAETKKHIISNASVFVLFILMVSGCWKSENIKLAEEEIERGNSIRAANLYSKELNRSDGDEQNGLISLNAGLAYLKSGELELAQYYLQLALASSTDIPHIQSKALNALGNVYYTQANFFLDRQDVSQAREAWEKARESYSAAFSIDGNSLAQENLSSLNKQLQERIETLVCRIEGIVWRDINGNGKPDTEEPLLSSLVFWDKNQDGEYNQSSEPSIQTNHEGRFGFEWISGKYPTTLAIASSLLDKNQSLKDVLLPLFPPPPPPLNAAQIRSHILRIDKPGTYSLMLPWRAAPLLTGKIWNDLNANAKIDPDESGTSTATIFIDINGNNQMDKNETAFKPAESGTFSKPVPPGQYSVGIIPDNPEANITYPIENHKAYLTWVDFEQNSIPLNFGLQQDGNESSSSNNSNEATDQPSDQETSDDADGTENPENFNALYERLLQESESNSKPLRFEPKLPSVRNRGLNH